MPYFLLFCQVKRTQLELTIDIIVTIEWGETSSLSTSSSCAWRARHTSWRHLDCSWTLSRSVETKIIVSSEVDFDGAKPVSSRSTCRRCRLETRRTREWSCDWSVRQCDQIEVAEKWRAWQGPASYFIISDTYGKYAAYCGGIIDRVYRHVGCKL